MNRKELIEVIAKEADISKTAADKALKAFIEATMKTVKKGNKVSLVGFGTFERRSRAARTGRNPQTGATIKIKASKAPAFKPGKSFKDFVN